MQVGDHYLGFLLFLYSKIVLAKKREKIFFQRQDNLPDWCQPFWPLPSDEAAFAPVEEGRQCGWVSWRKGCNCVFSRSHGGGYHTLMMVIV